jgi:AcrR family transcriptional regulator
MKQEIDTKQKILDSAQHLFASQGFQATSLRSITKRAGVNIAAINYHFGSKEALLNAVIERHLIPLNKVRVEKLKKVSDTARQEGRRPSVSDLIIAIVEPTLQFRDTSPDAEDFIALVGRAFYDPEFYDRSHFSYDEALRRQAPFRHKRTSNAIKDRYKFTH